MQSGENAGLECGRTGGVCIRDAGPADLPAILRILNTAIATTTARWSDTPETLAGLDTWLAVAASRGDPVLVASESAVVLGYGSFAPFRSYPGFRYTVEHSLYVDPAAQRRGVGRALLGALEARARASDLHTMVGLIAADNAASLALHRASGFAQVGLLAEVGFKFDRWLDLVVMQKMLRRDASGRLAAAPLSR